MPRSKAYVQLSVFIFRRGAAPRLLVHSACSALYEYSNIASAAAHFFQRRIYFLITRVDVKNTRHTSSACPLFVVRSQSSFLLVSLHSFLAEYMHTYVYDTTTCTCVQRGRYNGEQIVRRKVVFSAVVGTISYKRNKRNISNGENPHWRKWMEPFLGKCNYHWLYVRSSNFLNGYEETWKKNAIPHFESF